MKNVIVAWCKTNEHDFESFVPLKFVGTRNKKLGFSNNLNILFLDGFNKLSQEYKQDLQGLGFKLWDVFDIYHKFDQKYFQLSRFGDYEKKCFLRWLVIDEFFAGEDIIHYDGDIVFNEDVDIIANKIKGKTFILQGCPAFTSIFDRAWFVNYKKELDLFVSDIEGYSAKSWQERDGWQVTFNTRWAGSRFRKIIHSDQDFLSHLIHTGRILQDSVESISLVLKDYILFENPLLIHMYDNNFAYEYSRENGIDYFYYRRDEGQDCEYKKQILFWHMQSCFNFYLAKFIFRKKFLKIPMGRLPLNLSSKGFEEYLNKKLNRFLKHTNRLSVYSYYFEKNDFKPLLKDSIWWKKGIFS